MITKIREAMERIEAGTYGKCEICGGEISEKRLIARPVTTMCIACKSRQEALEAEKQGQARGQIEYRNFRFRFHKILQNAGMAR